MTDAANEAVDAAQPVATNLSNQAHQAISEMIQRRRLRGGEVIVESRLAEVLNISRTPLREALQRLEGEGLVIKGTGRSFMVRHVDLREYLQKSEGSRNTGARGGNACDRAHSAQPAR